MKRLKAAGITIAGIVIAGILMSAKDIAPISESRRCRTYFHKSFSVSVTWEPVLHADQAGASHHLVFHSLQSIQKFGRMHRFR